MNSVLEKLTALGLELPKFNTRGGNYQLYTRFGNLIYTAGQVCLQDDVLLYKGTVGTEIDIETPGRGASLRAQSSFHCQ